MTTPIPDAWTLSASAFNLTPTVIEARRDATEVAASLVAEGLASHIEVELGQLWRSFPEPLARDARALRDMLAQLGGRVSIVGGSIDDWAGPNRRRSDDERYDFLLPQLRTAAALGATGLRLPLGQAGADLLHRLVPVLEELDVVLFEEAQGSGSPSNPAVAPAYDTIARIDSPHLRLLVDISMLMPALPVTYLELLDASDLPRDLVRRLRDEWQDPATTGAIVDVLRAGEVPPGIHTLFMNLLVRFGRSSVAELDPVLPLLSAVHLKFWDLDDRDDRVSRPIRELGATLRRSGFAGTLCSEWGGQEWLDDDPLEITRAHLALASAALAASQKPAAA
ncbi:restriction endonuclease subunit R [Microbacterium sp. NPDC057407]|uniref:restriction endonuclease subunit R n=1 Tax=Microbacterium sp. NPDC057407 TaxID=3346120 RepID=UPI00366C273F